MLFAMKALCPNVSNKHIKVLVDNSATVGAINNMGSSKSLTLNDQIKMIWLWILSRGNWLTSSHIPGILNVEADEESRKSESKTEWKLNKNDFHFIVKALKCEPSIDLFATRINTQLPRFVAYRPDPEAEEIDDFSISWENLQFYAFPPFACVDRVLQKILKDKAIGILVVPDWPNQHWYHMLAEVTIYDIILHPRLDLLFLPNNPKLQHPLQKHLRLRAALVSGAN